MLDKVIDILALLCVIVITWMLAYITPVLLMHNALFPAMLGWLLIALSWYGLWRIFVKRMYE